MTNYPPMPPQGPYGYGAPPPQQPPYGYGGVPPQQPPYGYGGPPPAGYGGPPPPGYGYPPPGYGGPPPHGYGGPPPPKGPGKWLLIGGLAAAAVVALVVVIAVASGSGGSSPATSAGPDTSIGSGGDEAAIRQMIANMASSNSRDFASVVQKYFCTADQELLESIGGPSGIDLPDSSGEKTGDGEITDIKVTGDKATAKARVGGMTSTMYFRKEAGAWKFCMSDAPEIANLPDFPR